MRRTVISTTAVLSSLLLLVGSVRADATGAGAGQDAIGFKPKSASELHEQWRLGTMSRIAYLLASQQDCKLNEAEASTDMCRKLETHGEDVSALESWADEGSDFGNLKEAALLHSSSQNLFGKTQYRQAEEALDKSIVLQLFPFADEGVQNKWHNSLLDPYVLLKHQRKELADAFMLLAAACLEAGYQTYDLRLLLKSHFALDTAIELFLLDDSSISENEYTIILHMDILASLEETIPTASSTHLKEVAEEAGLDCEKCENDFDYRRKIMQAVDTGIMFDVSEDVRSSEVDRCAANQILQQSTTVVVHQISQFLASPMLGPSAAAVLRDLHRPCYEDQVEGKCSSHFSPALHYTVQCIDMNEDGSPINERDKRAKKGPHQLSLSKTEKKIRNILKQKFDYASFEESNLRSNAPCNNPKSTEDDQGREFFAWNQPVHHTKEGVRKPQTILHGADSTAMAGAGGNGMVGSSYDYQKDISRLEKELQKEPQFSSEQKGDDPIVPITLFFMLVFYFGSWMLWKNRKLLRRRVAEYDLWNKEYKRDNSKDTALVRMAISSGDIHKLEDALNEVSHADPAVLRRARTLLAQKKKQKKEADVARAKAKAAKQRASALKKEEKTKKVASIEPISTAATIAAVRAKVERERQAESPRSERSNTFDSSMSDEDFMPVVAQQSSRRKRATTTGSLKAVESDRDAAAASGASGASASRRNNSDTQSHSGSVPSANGDQGANAAASRNPGRHATRERSKSGHAKTQSGSHFGAGGAGGGGRRLERKSFDKGGPATTKGRDAYVNFRKRPSNEHPIGFYGDSGGRDSGRDMGNNNASSKYKHPHSGQNGAASALREERRYSNRGSRRYGSNGSRGAHYVARGHSTGHQTSHSQQGLAMRAQGGQERERRALNGHGGGQQAGSAQQAPSKAYGSSLYQTDLIGSLVGSYSPFKANGKSTNGAGQATAGGGGSKGGKTEHKTGGSSYQPQWGWSSGSWHNNGNGGNGSAPKRPNPASASIPKHMRANSFPEVDHDFEVDLNSNSEGTVEWLPSKLIDSLVSKDQ